MAQAAKQNSQIQDKTPHPVKCKEGRGVRNFDCRYYDSCLVKAAKNMWPGFTCARCEYYEES
jgi:hypothetical protein